MTRLVPRTLRKVKLLTVAALSLTLSGCSWLFSDMRSGREHQSSTPLVDFLYWVWAGKPAPEW